MTGIPGDRGDGPECLPVPAVGSYRMPMRDRDIVAAVIASDPAGLAAAYDRYAANLFSYCQVLLTQPADAADAVQERSSSPPARSARCGPGPAPALALRGGPQRVPPAAADPGFGHPAGRVS